MNLLLRLLALTALFQTLVQCAVYVPNPQIKRPATKSDLSTNSDSEGSADSSQSADDAPGTSQGVLPPDQFPDDISTSKTTNSSSYIPVVNSTVLANGTGNSTSKNVVDIRVENSEGATAIPTSDILANVEKYQLEMAIYRQKDQISKRFSAGAQIFEYLTHGAATTEGFMLNKFPDEVVFADMMSGLRLLHLKQDLSQALTIYFVCNGRDFAEIGVVRGMGDNGE